MGLFPPSGQCRGFHRNPRHVPYPVPEAAEGLLPSLFRLDIQRPFFRFFPILFDFSGTLLLKIKNQPDSKNRPAAVSILKSLRPSAGGF